jgi:hypothetical protein
MIQKEFEHFLEILKEAGAELIFLFLKDPVTHEQKWLEHESFENQQGPRGYASLRSFAKSAVFGESARERTRAQNFEFEKPVTNFFYQRL